MQAYLRPSGINGTRFNSRLAKAHKATARALKAQRAADAQLLESVREFLRSGGGLATMPPWMHTKVFLEWRDNASVCEVSDRSTRRLLGRIATGMEVRQW